MIGKFCIIAVLLAGQLEKQIFEANRRNPKPHRLVAAEDLLQRLEEFNSALYEQSHHPVVAFDVNKSSQPANCGKITSSYPLQLYDLRKVELGLPRICGHSG
jgi:hypothetical protein